MRILVTIMLSFLLLSPATAATIRPMEASPSVDELRRACSAAGGTFTVDFDGGGYGCSVENCDGKGGRCTIACDNNNNCNGSTPSLIQGGMTLLGILQDGNMVYYNHEPQSSSGGTTSAPNQDSANPAGTAPPSGFDPSQTIN